MWFICGQTILWIFIVAERTVKWCAENNISVTKYYANNVKYRLKSHLWGSNGVVDSILTLTNNYTKQNRHVLNLLLKSF